MQAFKGRFRLKPAATTVGTVVLVLVIYVGFLAIYRMLDHHSGPESADLDLSRDNETVVVIDLQDLRTVNNRLDAEVVVLPAKTTLDAFGLLNADMSVRLVSSLDYGERHFPRGTLPRRWMTRWSRRVTLSHGRSTNTRPVICAQKSWWVTALDVARCLRVSK